MQRTVKYLTLALYGGVIYYIIEAFYKSNWSDSPTHWSMALVGALAFLLVGGINNYLPWRMSIVLQCLIGAAAITALELVAGLILNVWLGLGIWDYSGLPLSLWGQICLPFSAVWVVLSLVCIVLDDFLRYWIFGEERPKYYLFKGE